MRGPRPGRVGARDRWSSPLACSVHWERPWEERPGRKHGARGPRLCPPPCPKCRRPGPLGGAFRKPPLLVPLPPAQGSVPVKTTSRRPRQPARRCRVRKPARTPLPRPPPLGAGPSPWPRTPGAAPGGAGRARSRRLGFSPSRNAACGDAPRGGGLSRRLAPRARPCQRQPTVGRLQFVSDIQGGVFQGYLSGTTEVPTAFRNQNKQVGRGRRGERRNKGIDTGRTEALRWASALSAPPGAVLQEPETPATVHSLFSLQLLGSHGHLSWARPTGMPFRGPKTPARPGDSALCPSPPK